MTTTVTTYRVEQVACPCGCQSSGWLVRGDEWHANQVVSEGSATLAACMLNEGRITRDELSTLWAALPSEDALEQAARDVAVLLGSDDDDDVPAARVMRAVRVARREPVWH